MRKHSRSRKSFSLIELLIVIGILGALAALILPSFTSTEKDAKGTADAYNSSGIVRYVHMFQNANGYFPSGFHTGLDTGGAPLEKLPEAFVTEGEDGKVALNDAFSPQALTNAEGAKYIESLKEAGINYLGAGDVSDATMTPLKNTSVTANVIKLKLEKAKEGEEDSDSVKNLKNLTFGGRKLADWVKPLGFEMSTHPDDGIVVVLFVTPNVDWENVYSGGYHSHGTGAQAHGHFESVTASKVALKNTPASTVSDADFKYYACLFKLNNDGKAAQLIGAVSPELKAAE